MIILVFSLSVNIRHSLTNKPVLFKDILIQLFRKTVFSNSVAALTNSEEDFLPNTFL